MASVRALAGIHDNLVVDAPCQRSCNQTTVTVPLVPAFSMSAVRDSGNCLTWRSSAPTYKHLPTTTLFGLLAKMKHCRGRGPNSAARRWSPIPVLTTLPRIGNTLTGLAKRINECILSYRKCWCSLARAPWTTLSTWRRGSGAEMTLSWRSNWNTDKRLSFTNAFATQQQQDSQAAQVWRNTDKQNYLRNLYVFHPNENIQIISFSVQQQDKSLSQNSWFHFPKKTQRTATLGLCSFFIICSTKPPRPCVVKFTKISCNHFFQHNLWPESNKNQYTNYKPAFYGAGHVLSTIFFSLLKKWTAAFSSLN